jgi:hypothetical protein
VSALIDWLDGRRPAAPPSLRRVMADALERGDPGTGELAERLAAAGLDLLRIVIAGPPGREGALTLLAADALLTYACEAAVEEEAMEGNGAVARLTAALEPARFERVLQEQGAAP